MRIIGGEKGGLTLSHPGRRVRVTLDSVRETLFNILGASVEGAAVLDLFAGSGSLGIEALSRGAAHCTFVERDRSLTRLLAGNLARLGLESRARVITADLRRVRTPAWLKDRPYDAVFMDPPYERGLTDICMDLLARIQFGEEPWVVLESGSREEVVLPEGWVLARDKKFGQTRVRFLAPVPAQVRSALTTALKAAADWPECDTDGRLWSNPEGTTRA
ncbi:MAG: 16S rRNA (guanine(966)-N(2))-methyltransferase RsmD [Nitrospirae bacterium]|nr:16S rRNA (guanine(966)-N(2))-methyltransferase RsmD [Nitrospirota bacterium]